MNRRIKGIVGILLTLLPLFMADARAEVLLLNGISTGKLDSFLQEHPGTKLESESYTFYETTAALEKGLQSKTQDVFDMLTAVHDVKRIFNEGYCLDLSDSEIIRKAIDRMYPAVAAQCMANGKIYAIPTHVQMNYLAISLAQLEHAGMHGETIPTTFPEFLDLIERWIGHLKAHPGTETALCGSAFWGDAAYYHGDSYTVLLVELLLENTMMQQECAGETITFDAQLLPMLERCAQLGRELYQYDPGVQGSASILQSVASGIMEDYDYMSLKLQADQPDLLSVTITLNAVAADTLHPELCISMLEALCLHNEPSFDICIYQDAETGTRSAAELEKIHGYAKYFFVEKPEGFHDSYSEKAAMLKQLTRRFAQGQIDAEALLQELNRLTQRGSPSQ